MQRGAATGRPPSRAAVPPHRGSRRGSRVRILGISCYYHDSAACLRRRTAGSSPRRRRSASPARSTTRASPTTPSRYCLGEAGSRPASVDARRLLRQAAAQVRPHPRDLPGGGAARAALRHVMAMPVWLREKLWIAPRIQEALDALRHRRCRSDSIFTEHHESHAASAFYPSPFERGRGPDPRRRRRVGHRRRSASARATQLRLLARDPLPALARPALLGLHLLHRASR